MEKPLLCLFSSLLMSLFLFAQEKASVFPDDFLGIYEGTLKITSTTRPLQEVPMEFHLLTTDTSGRYQYRLIYDGQPRNYTLVSVDDTKGIYEVDENNGILLPARFEGNTLYSFFEVGGNLLSSRLEFQANQLNFEILFTKMNGKIKTGAEEHEELNIHGYPITVVQKAILKRKS